jgi:hypothetical protein
MRGLVPDLRGKLMLAGLYHLSGGFSRGPDGNLR